MLQASNSHRGTCACEHKSQNHKVIEIQQQEEEDDLEPLMSSSSQDQPDNEPSSSNTTATITKDVIIRSPEEALQDELFQAIKSGDSDAVTTFISQHGSHPYLFNRDAEGHTTAHWAAHSGNIDTLQLLASNGVDMNVPSNDSVKLHPIHWTCTRGNLPALHFFVSSLRISINTADAFRQRTPLLLASQGGHTLLVMYCIKNGATLDILDADSDSAVHWAAYNGTTEIISVFQYFKLGLKLSLPDGFGQSPLHLAAMQGHLDTVIYLVEELDCDESSFLYAKDAKDRMPIDLAVLKHQSHVVTYLKGAMRRSKWDSYIKMFSKHNAPFVFVWANVVLVGVWYVSVLMRPGAVSSSCSWLLMTHLLINFFTWSFFIKAWKTPASTLQTDEGARMQYEEIVEQIADCSTDIVSTTKSTKLCHTCSIKRPVRAKHCRVCKICVAEFDHHCPFINNCVGASNYGSFFAFVFCVTLNCLVMAVILAIVSIGTTSASWVTILGCVYYSILTLLVSNLLVFQIYLCYKGLTTNEISNLRRYRYLYNDEGKYENPFDNGPLKNFIHRLFPAKEKASIRGKLSMEDCTKDVALVV